MNTTATNVKLRKLLTGIKNDTLIPRPDFQRRLVWSQKHKNAFIRTVIEGYPFPEIYIAAGEVDEETGEGKEILVDGQQRITTLYQYFADSDLLKIEADIPFYKDLVNKTEFLEYEVVVRDLGKMEIEDIKEIFLRINSTNYSLNPMEINNARFDGAIKKFAEEIAQNDFFSENKIFTGSEIRRMGDTKFVLAILITLISNYFNRDNELEAYLSKYNDEFPNSDELNKNLIEIFRIVERLNFNLKHRVWKKADLFSLIIELYKSVFKLGLKVDQIKLKKNLESFYEKVDSFNPEHPNNESSVITYVTASRSGTNDRSSRVGRGTIISEIIAASI